MLSENENGVGRRNKELFEILIGKDCISIGGEPTVTVNELSKRQVLPSELLALMSD